MYDAETLLDLHARGHRSLEKLIAHCRGFEPALLEKPLDGFGYSSVRIQLIHEIGAEAYWISVLTGGMDAQDRDGVLLTLDAVEAWRREVVATTRAYLLGASPAELGTPRTVRTWQGTERTLVPALAVVRTFTHLYHHQGQITAMCRLLGRPVNGLDFPIE